MLSQKPQFISSVIQQAVHTLKNGFFYEFDHKTGDLISGWRLVAVLKRVKVPWKMRGEIVTGLSDFKILTDVST
jgi:hypothetical protein